MAKKIEYDYNAKQLHSRSQTYPQYKTSYCYIDCPFCKATTKAFIWSLAGSGKKCNGCGALHGSFGYTMPVKKL